MFFQKWFRVKHFHFEVAHKNDNFKLYTLLTEFLITTVNEVSKCNARELLYSVTDGDNVL